MKKLKTSFSLTPKTKHTIDILASKLELSKSAILTLAIQDFSKRSDSYSEFFGENPDRIMDELTSIIGDKLTINDVIHAFYAIIIELEKRANK